MSTQPKYKVIADYPGSLYSVGTIVSDLPNATGWAEWAEKYPHLFQTIQDLSNNAEEGKQTFSEEDIWEDAYDSYVRDTWDDDKIADSSLSLLNYLSERYTLKTKQ